MPLKLAHSITNLLHHPTAEEEHSGLKFFRVLPALLHLLWALSQACVQLTDEGHQLLLQNITSLRLDADVGFIMSSQVPVCSHSPLLHVPVFSPVLPLLTYKTSWPPPHTRAYHRLLYHLPQCVLFSTYNKFIFPHNSRWFCFPDQSFPNTKIETEF